MCLRSRLASHCWKNNSFCLALLLSSLPFASDCRVSGTKCGLCTPISPSTSSFRRMELWWRSGTSWERSTSAVSEWGPVSSASYGNIVATRDTVYIVTVRSSEMLHKWGCKFKLWQKRGKCSLFEKQLHHHLWVNKGLCSAFSRPRVLQCTADVHSVFPLNIYDLKMYDSNNL